MNPIALLGGTFDPVHVGHLGLARSAFAQLKLQKLLLLPVGNPYQKGRRPYASGAQRVDMLRIAFHGNSDVVVDERELRRDGPTYTFDTLVELRAEYGEAASLVWLIGSDAFLRLDTWHRWRELFDLTHFAVIDRAGHELASARGAQELRKEVEKRLAGLLATHESPSGSVVMLGMTPPPVSSTDIRARLARRETVRQLVPDAVCDYIEQHKLYLSEE
ncbi:MAG: nicotinate-nucleotide adenylyltransferase [Betaproteobacteria bacterium]|nr:nicotinate-nucleotide adenylyltransferase [Betaproteobacteria bacterium]